MKYKTKEFDEFLEKCIEHNQYVGLGNPFSKILIIGKEAGFDPNIETESADYSLNAKYLKENNMVYAESYPAEGKLKNGKHTWQRYQKFYNLLSNTDPKEKYYINFVENVFTTELSNLPYPNSKGAVENERFAEELKNRKKYFFDSDFIRKFPVVIIAASDAKYISNYREGDSIEIDKIFKVKFEKEVKCNDKNNKYRIHYSRIEENVPKLVIHTRQFVNGASNKLLENIANEISNFANENNIDFRE